MKGKVQISRKDIEEAIKEHIFVQRNVCDSKMEINLIGLVSNNFVFPDIEKDKSIYFLVEVKEKELEHSLEI